MAKTMVHHLPLTEARHHLGEVVKRVHLNKECFILEKDGIPVAGLLNVAELEDYLDIQDTELQEHIEESYKEYREGKGRDARKFLAELKTDLAK